MTDLNLLPWREHARKRNKQQFWLHLLGGSLLACGVMFLMTVYVSQQIHQLKSNLIQLRHTQHTASALKRQDITQYKSQMIHAHITHFLMSFERVIPAGIHLKRVEEHEEEVILCGQAKSADAILQLIHNIETEIGTKASVTNEAIAQDRPPPEGMEHAFNIHVLFREAKGA